MNTIRLAGKQVVFSGGGYFRFFNNSLLHYLFRNKDYVMTYFHPRDFDPDQPVLDSLPMMRKWMSYTGLKKSQAKFESILSKFRFTDVRGAVAGIDWSKTGQVQF